MSEQPTDMPPGMDRPTTYGLIACGAVVAAFSGWSQFETARMAGWPAALAWVLPVATDVTALLATQTWLASPVSSGLRRYSATLALLCMVLSCVMAAVHAITGTLPTWAHGAISALPGAVLAAIIHLGGLRRKYVTRLALTPPAAPPVTERVETPDTAPAPPVTPPAVPEIEVSSPTTDAPDLTPDPPATVGDVAVEEAGASVVNLPTVSNKRTEMWAWLTEHGAEGVKGTDLDRRFETRTLGAKVLREFRASRSDDAAVNQ